MTLSRHEHEVFNTNAATTRNVDAGFYSDDHARLQRHVARGPKCRLLVDVQAYPMSKAMAEMLAMPVGLQIGPGNRVDPARPAARAHLRQGSPLG